MANRLYVDSLSRSAAAVPHNVLHVIVDGVGTVTARADGEFGVHHGDKVFLTPAPDKIHRFDAEGQALQ